MATTVTRDGQTIRVDYFARWYGRLFALPLLAASVCLLYYAFLALKDDVSGLEGSTDNLAGLLVCFALGLAIGLPGLMVATFRYHVLVDKALCQVIVARQFGPLKFRRPRMLSDFTLISITDDGETRGSMFSVNLCGNRGTNPVVLSGFTKRQAADDFARELGSALELPSRDLVDTGPYDPDLDREAQVEGAALSRGGRNPGMRGAASS
jgi:hypothetical protein